jgi:phosphoenolpyruvate carboxylase
MADTPTIRQSVDLRESIVLPLITIQQYALQTLAEKGSILDEALQQQLRKLVLRSMFGNINATRNAA